jgi:hypothetical protein
MLREISPSNKTVFIGRVLWFDDASQFKVSFG